MTSRSIPALVAIVASTSVVAQTPIERPGRPVSFVACPQFRDTLRQCWLAEYAGNTYYIGAFGIGTAPQLLHRVLVEGVAHDDERSCGAINVDPIRLSPLPEIAPECDAVLPDNGSGPREGSRFDLPAAVLAQNGASLPPPPPMRTDTTFAVSFDFDSESLNLLNQAKVEMIAMSIVASPVQRVAITGRQGRSRLSNGTVMRERPELATIRAAAIRKALSDLGVSPEVMEILNAQTTAVDASISDVESRDVTVQVELAPSGK